MEDLTELLSVNFSVTKTPLNVNAEHPRFSQFKQKTPRSTQEERRLKKLELQKQSRFDFQNFARRLADGDLSDDDEKEEENEEDMEWSEERKPRARSYKDQLMYSEWLVDVPSDLREEYYLKLCPVGTRCLIIAARGSTIMYRKNGRIAKNFPSRLPGGNRKQFIKGEKHTILDCIFNEVNKTFYVLDVMCWNGHPVYDSDTEFRFYWLQSKFVDNPEVSQVSGTNPYMFECLPHHSCTEESIFSVMNSSLPFTPELDGILFYHKKTHYTPGSTPLVGWLKAFMIPEILSVEISDFHKQSAPKYYSGVKEHIVQYEQEQEEKRKGRQQNTNGKADTKSETMQ